MDSTLGGSPGGRRQGWCKTVKLKIKLSLVAVGSIPLYQQNYYVKPKLELYWFQSKHKWWVKSNFVTIK